MEPRAQSRYITSFSFVPLFCLDSSNPPEDNARQRWLGLWSCRVCPLLSLSLILESFCFVISRLLALNNTIDFCKISCDLKLAAMRIHDQGILSVGAIIIDCLQISQRTFYRILNLWVTTGDVVRHTNGIRGRPQILHHDDIDCLRHIIRHRPDWYLDELLDLLKTNRFISALSRLILRLSTGSLNVLVYQPKNRRR